MDERMKHFLEMREFFKKVELVAEWERENGAPACDCLTQWYDDYGMEAPKPGVGDGQIESRYNLIMAEQREFRGACNAVGNWETKNVHEYRDRLTCWDSDTGGFVPKGAIRDSEILEKYARIQYEIREPAPDSPADDIHKESHHPHGANYWRKTAVIHGLEEAAIICGRYFDTQIRTDSAEENQFCKELFAAMYVDTAGYTDPAKIVYPYSYAHARERLEESLYHDSRKQSEACVKGIDSAIRDCCYEANYYNLRAAARKSVANFGFERVNLVLVHNLQKHGHDGRFSTANKQWADEFDLGERFTSSVLLNAHPVLIDSFIKYTREMYAELGAERFSLPGWPERGEHVQGYEILRSVQFDNDRGFALAHNPDAPSPYVSWQFTMAGGQRDFYWGRYSETEQGARDSYCTRVALYLRDELVSEVMNPIAAVELSTEQNCNQIDGLRNNMAHDKADLTDGQTHDEIRELVPETLPKGKPSLLAQIEKFKSDSPSQAKTEPAKDPHHNR